MKKLIIIFSFLIICVAVYSQKLATYNLHIVQSNLVNPAATAIEECTRFRLTDKHQWIGIKGAPCLQAFSIEVPKKYHKYKMHGFGLNLIRDKNGATQSINGELIYTFHIQFGKLIKRNISFGLSANIGQHIFDERDFTENITDPIVGRGIEQELSYNASFGIYYYGEKIFGGIAAYNPLPVNTGLYYGYGNENYFITATAGANLEPKNNRFKLKSWLYGNKGEQISQIDLNNIFYFKNNVFAGLTVRKYLAKYAIPGQNLLIILGYNYNQWNIFYSYDIGLNKFQYRHTGSHMLSVGYKICRDKYDCPTY